MGRVGRYALAAVVGEFVWVVFHSKRGVSPIDLVAELSIFTRPSFVAATGG